MQDNRGNGHASYDKETGRWLAEAINAEGIELDSSDVTLRGFLVRPDPTPADHWGGYVLTGGPGNIVVEYGEVDGNGNPGVATTLSSSGLGPSGFVRNVDVRDWRVGFHAWGGVT